MTGALGYVLNDTVRTHENPPRQTQAQAKINVFTIHVIALIKPSNLGERGAAQQHEGRIDPIGRACTVRRHLVPAAKKMATQQTPWRW